MGHGAVHGLRKPAHERVVEQLRQRKDPRRFTPPRYWGGIARSPKFALTSE
jgi:hypothetical protein